jgi:hypothetical protein
MHERDETVYSISVGRPEGKRPLEISQRRWEDNIRMDFREIACEAVDWMNLDQDRDKWWALVNTVMKL